MFFECFRFVKHKMVCRNEAIPIKICSPYIAFSDLRRNGSNYSAGNASGRDIELLKLRLDKSSKWFSDFICEIAHNKSTSFCFLLTIFENVRIFFLRDKRFFRHDKLPMSNNQETGGGYE